MPDITFAEDAFDEYLSWQSEDKKTLRRINQLLKAVTRDPFRGEGKPEALRGNHSGKWSRRINDRDRLVYAVQDGRIVVYQCRGHYDDK